MSSTTHYVRADGSREHRRMVPTCKAPRQGDAVTIVTEFVTCQQCKDSRVFRRDQARDN